MTTMSPREMLAEVDRLRSQARRAKQIHALLDVKRNGSLDIGHSITLYQHAAYPDDLILLDLWRRALEQYAADSSVVADRLESSVTVVTQ